MEYCKKMNLVRVRMMSLIDDILAKKEKIAVIGLGYVGIPLAVAFADIARVIGFDINQEKIELYLKGIDPTKEVGDAAIKTSGIEFTSEEERLKEAGFLIIAVPTPVKRDHSPDLTAVEAASRTAGRNLRPGAVVVYESTVYPGVTEEVCIPILEAESGMKCGRDFSVGYSPERINPGDREHRLATITKVVAGYDAETTDLIAGLYEKVVKAGIYKAGSIMEAEAAKVIENSQRDINIAFMNELSLIFHKMGIDTKEVLKAAATKWNFLPFAPGLVGGHCIGVDPYYLTYQAERLGYHSQVILSGRKINDEMGTYVAQELIKKIMISENNGGRKNIGILGFTFKENCPDTRNSRVYDIVKELREYGLEPVISDPIADLRETREEYGIDLVPLAELKDMDALIIAVAHKEYTELTPEKLGSFFRPGPCKNRILFDLKGIFDKKTYEELGYRYWRL